MVQYLLFRYLKWPLKEFPVHDSGNLHLESLWRPEEIGHLGILTQILSQHSSDIAVRSLWGPEDPRTGGSKAWYPSVHTKKAGSCGSSSPKNRETTWNNYRFWPFIWIILYPEFCWWIPAWFTLETQKKNMPSSSSWCFHPLLKKKKTLLVADMVNPSNLKHTKDLHLWSFVGLRCFITLLKKKTWSLDLFIPGA